MANPQLENGYTRISNELLDAIGKANLSATEIEIILCVIRFTYGFGRKSHRLSASFIAGWTGRNKRGIKECLKRLILNKIIIVVNSKAGITSEIKLNKNYEEWKSLSGVLQTTSVAEYTSVPQYTAPVYANTPVVVYHSTPKKENINKSIKKNIYEHFFESLWEMYPRKRGKSSVTAKAMRELQAAGFEKVASAISLYKKEIAGMDEKYILHGSTFFNGRWKDYVLETTCADNTAADSENTNLPFERFKELELDVFEEYRRLGIINDEGGIDYSLMGPEQQIILQKAGAL